MASNDDSGGGKEVEGGNKAGYVGGEPLDDAPARFALKSIVCHKGASIHAGHYVAFVRREGGLPEQPAVGGGDGGSDTAGSSTGGAAAVYGEKQIEGVSGSAGAEWVLYNDEKVALGGDVEEMKKFAYIYFLRRV
jgi:ubiquitin carboxyl-terminal hydrolase 5/13